MIKIYLDWHINPENVSDLDIVFHRYNCSETEVVVKNNELIHQNDVCIYHGFSGKKYNNSIIELILLCDVLKRNHVKSISLIAPFLPYTRQDKTMDIKSSLGCKVFADLLNYANIDKLTTFDLHAPQLEGFFYAKVDHKTMFPKFLNDIAKNHNTSDTMIVFPDAGSASRAKNYIQDYEYDVAIFNKNRKNGELQMRIVGNVNGMNCVVMDDIIDSGGTILSVAKILKENGAKDIFVYGTHGIFSGSAIENFEKSIIHSITVSNTIEVKKFSKIRVLDIEL